MVKLSTNDLEILRLISPGLHSVAPAQSGSQEAGAVFRVVGEVDPSSQLDMLQMLVVWDCSIVTWRLQWILVFDILRLYTDTPYYRCCSNTPKLGCLFFEAQYSTNAIRFYTSPNLVTFWLFLGLALPLPFVTHKVKLLNLLSFLKHLKISGIPSVRVWEQMAIHHVPEARTARTACGPCWPTPRSGQLAWKIRRGRPVQRWIRHQFCWGMLCYRSSFHSFVDHYCANDLVLYQNHCHLLEFHMISRSIWPP